MLTPVAGKNPANQVVHSDDRVDAAISNQERHEAGASEAISRSRLSHQRPVGSIKSNPGSEIRRDHSQDVAITSSSNEGPEIEVTQTKGARIGEAVEQRPAFVPGRHDNGSRSQG